MMWPQEKSVTMRGRPVWKQASVPWWVVLTVSCSFPGVGTGPLLDPALCSFPGVGTGPLLDPALPPGP